MDRRKVTLIGRLTRSGKSQCSGQPDEHVPPSFLRFTSIYDSSHQTHTMRLFGHSLLFRHVAMEVLTLAMASSQYARSLQCRRKRRAIIPLSKKSRINRKEDHAPTSTNVFFVHCYLSKDINLRQNLSHASVSTTRGTLSLQSHKSRP
jgi:hypothetical protein